MFGLGKKPIVLQVSAMAYDELASLLIASVDDQGVLDMTGVALTRGPEPELRPRHRSISKNTAPGAI